MESTDTRPTIDARCESSGCASEKRSYLLPMVCYNCGGKFRARFTWAHDFGHPECPYCGSEHNGRAPEEEADA